jgi:hypothetical protein
MARLFPRFVVTQIIIVVLAVTLFTGILTITGSVPTSDVPEHALRNENVKAMSGHEGGLTATATQVPDIDRLLSMPDMAVQSTPANLTGNGSQFKESLHRVPGTPGSG